MVALLLLSYECLVTVNALWLFLAVPWVGLRCVIVVFPDHTHLLFDELQSSFLLPCKFVLITLFKMPKELPVSCIDP